MVTGIGPERIVCGMGTSATDQHRRSPWVVAVAIVLGASAVRLAIEGWLEVLHEQAGMHLKGQADAGWNSWGWLTLLGTVVS